MGPIYSSISIRHTMNRQQHVCSMCLVVITINHIVEMCEETAVYKLHNQVSSSDEAVMFSNYLKGFLIM